MDRCFFTYSFKFKLGWSDIENSPPHPKKIEMQLQHSCKDCFVNQLNTCVKQNKKVHKMPARSTYSQLSVIVKSQENKFKYIWN